MTSQYRLIYGYDTLCGWCYGLIPALRHFSTKHPDVPVEVLPGGSQYRPSGHAVFGNG